VNIYLVGYRGTGKSSVSRRLLDIMEAPWAVAEMDKIIESRARKTIAEIFAKETEEGFRRRERSLLAELGRQSFWIVSTGGGIVLSPENRRVLKQGFTVWLKASVATIDARLSADEAHRASRPNLTAVGGRAEIEQMLAQRTPLYGEVARLTLSSDDSSPLDLARTIEERFRKAGFRS
jgi:shikimate kinase